MQNAQKLDDDDIRIKSPDLDLDDMAETVEETLKTTEDLAKRLGELNKEMMEYMYNYAQAKASNKYVIVLYFLVGKLKDLRTGY